MNPEDRDATFERRLPVLLLMVGASMLVLSAVAIWNELGGEWRAHQRSYQRLTEELAAPAGSEPVRTGIQQIMLPDIGIYDRCTTCHVGIDDPATADAPQPITAHPGNLLDIHPPERFGCTMCHGGQGLATTREGAAHEPIPYFHDPMMPSELLEARCGTCHQERVVAGATLLTGGRQLLATRGCYGCHEIPGYEHELPAGPGLDRVAVKLKPEWLAAWLENPPKTVVGARMPTFRLSAEERTALIAFLMADRGGPVEQVPDGLEGDSDNGRGLFGVSRCITCHAKEGKGGTLGPDLGAVGSKVTFEWLYAFLRDPHAYHPRTPMLRYDFSEQEALDLATFVSEELVSDDELPPVEVPLESAELIELGQRVFVQVGCVGCHAKGDLPLARIGPSLIGYGDRLASKLEFGDRVTSHNLADWTLAKLLDPHEVGGESTRMPNPHLAESDAAMLTLALLSLSERVTSPSYLVAAVEPKPFVPQGRVGVLWQRYRCSSCHQVGGYGGTISRAPLDREGSEVQTTWLRDYLVQPFAIRINQEERMPRFRMSVEDATVLSEYIDIALRDDEIPAEVPGGPFTDSERAQGEVLFQRLACATCHIRGGQGGYVGPPLDETGSRLNPGWLYTFLREPTRWRPKTLQPDYRLTGEDARSLTAYLSMVIPGEKGDATGDPEEIEP